MPQTARMGPGRGATLYYVQNRQRSEDPELIVNSSRWMYVPIRRPSFPPVRRRRKKNEEARGGEGKGGGAGGGFCLHRHYADHQRLPKYNLDVRLVSAGISCFFSVALTGFNLGLRVRALRTPSQGPLFPFSIFLAFSRSLIHFAPRHSLRSSAR